MTLAMAIEFTITFRDWVAFMLGAGFTFLFMLLLAVISQ